jgi:hypothetical protein
MLKQGDSKFITNEVYTCKFCGKTFDTVEAVNKHIDGCWMNYLENKFCFTCKNVVDIKQAPFKGNNNDYEMNVCNIVGIYDTLGCNIDICKGNCTQAFLEEEHPECYEIYDEKTDKPIVEYTAEYIEFSELLEEVIEEDDKIFEEIKAQDVKVIVKSTDEKKLPE